MNNKFKVLVSFFVPILIGYSAWRLQSYINGNQVDFLEAVDAFFGIFVSYLAKVLFFDVYGFPLIVLILLFGAIVFTFYFRFINISIL